MHKTDNKIIKSDRVVYKDDSYKDKAKKRNASFVHEALERIKKKNATYPLPESVQSIRRPLLTDALLINRDGRDRTLLADKPGKHLLLVHRNVAKVMKSKVCMFARITTNKDSSGRFIDGSWTIVPAQVRYMNATTIQHVKRRKLFFLHKYWYEISFDGRVQPAYLLYDYDVDPLCRKLHLWITREYVKVKKTGEDNNFFRIWKEKKHE